MMKKVEQPRLPRYLDIGEWRAEPARGDLPGSYDVSERLLRDPHAAAATELPPATVAEIVRDASGPPPTSIAQRRGALGAVPELRGALDAAQRAALIARMESAVALSDSADARHDLKLEIDEAELHPLIEADERGRERGHR